MINDLPIIATPRLLFRQWTPAMLNYALQLWGNPEVSRYIAVHGQFSREQIQERLKQEISNHQQYQLQYWPLYTREELFIGCCGLRPRNLSQQIVEIGCHLLPEFWEQGYAAEAITAVINHARERGFSKLFAGHNPQNYASQKMLQKLGFCYIGNEFYPPTGLDHPSYELDLALK